MSLDIDKVSKEIYKFFVKNNEKNIEGRKKDIFSTWYFFFRDLRLSKKYMGSLRRCSRKNSIDNKLGQLDYEIQNRIKRNIDNFHNSIQNLREILYKNNVIPIDDIKKEIEVMLKKWPSLEYNEDERFLYIETKNISLSYHDTSKELGRFKTGISLYYDTESYDGERLGFKAVSIDGGNPAHGNESVTHPHVKNDYICMGNGLETSIEAFYQGRIEDCFDIILAVLNTYSEGRAHIELDNWEGSTCDVCGNSVDGDEYLCQKCDRTICLDCTESCHCCDDIVCQSCSENSAHCSMCGEYTCNSCLVESGCDHDICADCERICGCGKSSCTKCCNECLECSEIVCEKCRFECGCKQIIHKDCAIKCNCDKEVCSDCSSYCEKCQGISCLDCKDKCCSLYTQTVQ